MPANRLTPDELLPRMQAIVARYPDIAAAWLFGSAARGDAGPESDVDVAILLRRPSDTAADHYVLLGDLAARLETVTAPLPIDLVVLDARRDPMFCHRVLVEGKRICEPDRERRIAFEADAVARALDFRPTYELALRGQAEGLRRRLRELR